MSLVSPKLNTQREEEWRELQAVLQSGILDNAPNLANFLNYVAERHFSGTTSQIKEYSVAVHALHRSQAFDPQSSNIVRVTAHTLRKKLEQYYIAEGANHPIHIRLPVGKYVLQFDRMGLPPATIPDLPCVQPPTELLAQSKPRRLRRKWQISLIAAMPVLLLLGIALLRFMPLESGVKSSVASTLGPETGSVKSIAAGAAQESSIHLRFGGSPEPFVDIAGQTWISDRYCNGGSTFSHSERQIEGTDDPTLFLNGREGKFLCRIPVPPGSYQLTLLFADTDGDKVGARQVVFSINDSKAVALDVMDEAGEDNLVVGKVYPGIHPESDGTIHLDFTSDAAFVNALEITRSVSDAGPTLRMHAGPTVFLDDAGNTWQPERFFRGGRRTLHPDHLPKVANAKLFEWGRYGHFDYLIPVLAGKEYRVRLYFSEGWFGASNGGPGGTGSRVFDVYCNGTTLLKNFDILREQKNGLAVITLDRVKPTAHGMLEIRFSPVENYPLINAIVVEPES